MKDTFCCRINKVEITNETLSSRGGLTFFVKYLQAIGIYELLLAKFGRLKKKAKGVRIRDLFKQVLCVLFDGTSRIGQNFGTQDVRLCSLEVLRDGTLIAAVTVVYSSGGKWIDVRSLFYRSQDGGQTFSGPTTIGNWGHEINVAPLPSGRLVAVIRYQRPRLPSDPANILEITGAQRWNHSFPYKHVFVADSTDGGKTWSRNRQVTTECGQCHGAAVGLRNKRVIVVYDHRYPRPMSSARALVSNDEGETWRDEVYYLSNGLAAGFARTITLDGEQMLTLTGSYSGKKLSWNDVIGNTQFRIIRWRIPD